MSSPDGSCRHFLHGCDVVLLQADRLSVKLHDVEINLEVALLQVTLRVQARLMLESSLTSLASVI